MARRLDKNRPYATLSPPWRGAHYEQDGRSFHHSGREVDVSDEQWGPEGDEEGGSPQLTPVFIDERERAEPDGVEPLESDKSDETKTNGSQGQTGQTDPAQTAGAEGQTDKDDVDGEQILKGSWFKVRAEVQTLLGLDVPPKNKEEARMLMEQNGYL